MGYLREFEKLVQMFSPQTMSYIPRYEWNVKPISLLSYSPLFPNLRSNIHVRIINELMHQHFSRQMFKLNIFNVSLNE